MSVVWRRKVAQTLEDNRKRAAMTSVLPALPVSAESRRDGDREDVIVCLRKASVEDGIAFSFTVVDGRFWRRWQICCI
jgi:hypothetical protein